MPHLVNIDGMRESLFLLQQLHLASHPYCSKHSIQRGAEEAGDIDWDYYAGMLKSVVCDHLIQVSTKLRILREIVSHNEDCYLEEEFNLETADYLAREGLVIATDIKGTELPVHEVCNKILHATETALVWDRSAEPPFEFWTGRVRLEGRFFDKDWRVILDVGQFCHAADRLLRNIEYNVDFRRVYKYDE